MEGTWGNIKPLVREDYSNGRYGAVGDKRGRDALNKVRRKTEDEMKWYWEHLW